MDVKMEFQNDILMYLMSNDMNIEDVNKVKSALDMFMCKYEISHQTTALVKYNNDNFKYLEYYLSTKKIEGKSQKTIDRYEYILKNFLCDFQDIEIKDIDIFRLRQYLERVKIGKMGHQLSGTSMDGIRRIICSFFNWLEMEELIVKNPTCKLARIKKDTQPEPSLTTKQIETILINADNARDRAICQLLYDTACRVGELINIKISDINLTENTCLVHGKGNKDRVVYFTDRASLYIKEYLNSRTDNNKMLFISKRGNKILKDGGIRAMLDKLGNKSKVTDMHPHRYRVARVTTLTKRGMNLNSVSKFVGHNDVNTTVGYCRFNNKDINDEYKKYVV